MTSYLTSNKYATKYNDMPYDHIMLRKIQRSGS